MIDRFLKLDRLPEETFFLVGPRKTGKSTLIKNTYKDVLRIDLLDTDILIRYQQRPALLRQELLSNQQRFIIIDEIQKVPALLDEVHNLIENHGFTFGLCGSSARKLKKGRANLLGGRALQFQLGGLVYPEIKSGFKIEKLLNTGYLPQHYLSTNYKKLHQSYVNTYLKEEIAEEGLVRNLPIFSDFLRSAAFSDTSLVSYATIGRDCGVSGTTVKEYFQILQDTLVGNMLPAYTKRSKRKVTHAPKFYFFDVAIVNYLTKRNNIQQGSEVFGKAFENWLFNELRLFIQYFDKQIDLSYWRLADSGKEVDFIINDMEIAIECKSTERIRTNDLKGLRTLADDYKVGQRILVCCESTKRITEDGIIIYPYQLFLDELWFKQIF